ncbi:MAG: hypothetical protein JWP97_4433 [Labilithrix sp.]|nr:hypothetical protein [Labilithrix sp.]
MIASSVLRFSSVVSVVLASASLSACVYDDDPPRHLGPDTSPPAVPAGGSSGTGGSSSGGSSGGSSGTSGTPTTTPMLVSVDSDQVMDADPGQGVGIFTEYGAGGKWHVWWTCDTARSQLPCDVVLSASLATGTLDELDTKELQNQGTAVAGANRVDVSVTTTTEVHGIRFTSTPGAVLQLQATIGGLTEGPGVNRSYFFFVQDGKINGGYTGLLTNPLQLQGNIP